MSDVVLELEQIDKSYPGVHALDHISLQFRKGEVHAIVGENGAGKSTMIKIVSGAEVADSGQVVIYGTAHKKLTPHQAIVCGVAVIYQELNGVPTLSAAENIFLGNPIRKGVLIDKKAMEKKAKELFDEIGIDIDPAVELGTLSVAYQQIVEIAKAISRECSLLIMDEPSASLTTAEVEILFKIIARLKASGATVLYISHKLEEVFRIADRVTVLRDGKHIQTMDVPETDQKQLIRLMVGRELDETYPAGNTREGEVCLEAKDISGPGVKQVSCAVRAGEILGIAGLVGAGRTEFARLVFGAEKRKTGTVAMNGRVLRLKRPADAIRAGVVLIPEDRKKQGLFMEQSVYDNTMVASLKDISHGLVVNKNKAKSLVKGMIETLRIKTPSAGQLVKNLSGGNQQKIVLAKWLVKGAQVFIFDEPTRGIDVGAKQEIYRLMRALNEEGKAIIMISSEMNELIGMSDRIVVMHEGVVTGHLEKKDFSSKKIMEYASGVS